MTDLKIIINSIKDDKITSFFENPKILKTKFWYSFTFPWTIMENIFELVWAFDLKVLIYLGFSIGSVTLFLIMLTNLKYLNPKVYPLIRNQ